MFSEIPLSSTDPLAPMRSKLKNKSRRHGQSLIAALFAMLFLLPAAYADEDASPVAALRAYAESHDETVAAEPETTGSIKVTEPKVSSALPASTASARDRMMPLIEKAARDHQLPPALLEAVVRIESRYNPNVRNAGAIGLMQIKLATARGIGFTGDANALSRPETNLHWGAKYLARAYHMSNGDTCLTLARYQGGHRVEKMGPAGKAYCAKIRTVLAQLD